MKDSIENQQGFATPVLFMIFNRPDTTRQVFNAIRSIKPLKLYIVADGPRPNRPDDIEKCNEAREVVNTIDWDCDVKKIFRTANFGCGKGPYTAITWFLEQEPEGIIIEDDCLPSPGFFHFCAEMLERYRYDTRIMEIGGNNFEPPSQRRNEFSYYFSHMTYIWGWATWRRAWNLYNFEMALYPEIQRKGYLEGNYDFVYEQQHFNYIFEKMYIGDARTSRQTVWDYQWQFIITINSGLVIVPERNLVTNLGFGSDATNTLDPVGAGNNIKLEEMEFPLRHPEDIMVERRRDHWYFDFICTSRAFRIRSTIRSMIPKALFELAFPFYKKYLRPKKLDYRILPGSGLSQKYT